MPRIWKEPDAHSAFILSLISTLITAIFAIIGVVFYSVSFMFCQTLRDCFSAVIICLNGSFLYLRRLLDRYYAWCLDWKIASIFAVASLFYGDFLLHEK